MYHNEKCLGIERVWRSVTQGLTVEDKKQIGAQTLLYAVYQLSENVRAGRRRMLQESIKSLPSAQKGGILRKREANG